MSSLLRTLVVLALLVLPAQTPAGADYHHPGTPDLRVDNIDIFWRRAEQKYIHFTIHIFNASVENTQRPFEVRLSVRSDDQEGWRPIKLWRETGLDGHGMLELYYQPGAIADTAIYTGHFQLRIEVLYQGELIDSQTQRYP